jgi:hypothetical protein
VHQGGFSLTEYIEMHGQQNIKFAEKYFISKGIQLLNKLRSAQKVVFSYAVYQLCLFYGFSWRTLEKRVHILSAFSLLWAG